MLRLCESERYWEVFYRGLDAEMITNCEVLLLWRMRLEASSNKRTDWLGAEGQGEPV